jgi:hypothetical protein
LKKLFADGGYQGPDFQKALAKILPQGTGGGDQVADARAMGALTNSSELIAEASPGLLRRYSRHNPHIS